MRNEFAVLLNGNPFAEGLVHYCHADTGCRCNGSREDTVKRIARLLMRLLFGRRPPVPQLSEWTSVKDCVCFLALGVGLNRIGPTVFSHSVSRLVPSNVGRVREELALVPAHAVPLEPAVHESAAQAIQGTEWHELVGRRIRFVREHIMAPSVQTHILLLAILTSAEASLVQHSRCVRRRHSDSRVGLHRDTDGVPPLRVSG